MHSGSRVPQGSPTPSDGVGNEGSMTPFSAKVVATPSVSEDLAYFGPTSKLFINLD